MLLCISKETNQSLCLLCNAFCFNALNSPWCISLCNDNTYLQGEVSIQFQSIKCIIVIYFLDFLLYIEQNSRRLSRHFHIFHSMIIANYNDESCFDNSIHYSYLWLQTKVWSLELFFRRIKELSRLFGSISLNSNEVDNKYILWSFQWMLLFLGINICDYCVKGGWKQWQLSYN